MNLCEQAIEAVAGSLIGLRSVVVDQHTCRISIPLLGPGDEPIGIWITDMNGRLVLSDGGETLMELEGLGVDSTRGRTADFVDASLASHSVSRSGYELHLTTEIGDMSSALFRLLDAVKDVGSTYFSSRPRAPRTVNARVASILHREKLQFERGFSIRGHQGLQRRFDFHVVRGSESLMRTLSTDSESFAQRTGELLAFHAIDIRARYPDRFRFLIVYDDDRLSWPEDIYRELESHEVLAIPVSDEAALLRSVAA
jgi:hypothetical protein